MMFSINHYFSVLVFAFGAGVCLCKQTLDSQSQKVSVPAVRLFSYFSHVNLCVFW